MNDEYFSRTVCRETALDRLKDAIALYEKERYLAVVYMSGYVIELGIKSEFLRIKEIKLRDIKDGHGTIIEYLFKNRFSANSNNKPEWVDSFNFPSTLYEFLNFIKNIACLEEKPAPKADEPKKVYNEIKDSNEFSVILYNRQMPTKDKGSTFHNITNFLNLLNEWKERVGESRFSIDDYKIDETYGWDSSLRYGEKSNNTKNDTEAQGALLMSIKFLKEVVSIDVSEYEEKLNPSNKENRYDNINKGNNYD